MAQKFLDRLSRVAKEELSDDNNTCFICQDEYGTNDLDGEPAEEAVRLPCPGGHIVGLNCISTWFSLGVNRTSCPCCRHEFTALSTSRQVQVRQPPPDHHRQYFQRWRNQRDEFLSMLVRAGGTPELVRKWDLWFVVWNEVAQEAHAEAIRRRRDESGSEQQPRIQGIETLHFREYFHYVLRRLRNGLTMGILNGPRLPLNLSDEADVLNRLRRKGAFQGVLHDVPSENARWEILRSGGYVFDEERRLWYAYLY